MACRAAPTFTLKAGPQPGGGDGLGAAVDSAGTRKVVSDAAARPVAPAVGQRVAVHGRTADRRRWDRVGHVDTFVIQLGVAGIIVGFHQKAYLASSADKAF